MTSWILTDKRLSRNKRPVLSSCESFRQYSLKSDARGNVEKSIIHGIASVYSAPYYRRRGYAGRLMTELDKVLRTYQAEHPVIGTVLYSDIGKMYYAKFGWHANATNFHFVFKPADVSWPGQAKELLEEDIEALCKRDQVMVETVMATAAEGVKSRITIIPDLDHMLRHIKKEDFAAKHIFKKIPSVKGAIAGAPGNQIWTVWTHRYYDHPFDSEAPDNVLYFLRLVVENDLSDGKIPSPEGRETVSYREKLEAMAAIMNAAQHEATEWKLEHVKVWDPSPLVQDLIQQTGIAYERVEREETYIASGMWYDDDGEPQDLEDAPLWINNEHYAWL